jgi:hypothetical protein
MLPGDRVQTTPHLVGHLFFMGFLENGQQEILIREHEKSGRPLTPYFVEAFAEAKRCRSLGA